MIDFIRQNLEDDLPYERRIENISMVKLQSLV